LVQSEQSILSFSESAGVVSPDHEAQLLLEQITQMQTARYQTLFELRAVEAEREALGRELDGIRPGLAQTLATNNNQLVAGLQQRITQLQVQKEGMLAVNPQYRGRE